jgi:hypothetical protein
MRMSRYQSGMLRLTAGACPSCSVFVYGPANDRPAVVYRRSHRSVTFRCERCRLQWTITLANLHKVCAAKAITPGERDIKPDRFTPLYSYVAQGTKGATVREKRGRKARRKRARKS